MNGELLWSMTITHVTPLRTARYVKPSCPDVCGVMLDVITDAPNLIFETP